MKRIVQHLETRGIKTCKCTNCLTGEYTISHYINPALMPNNEKNVPYKTVYYDKNRLLSKKDEHSRLMYATSPYCDYFVNIDTKLGKPTSFEQCQRENLPSVISNNDDELSICTYDKFGNMTSANIIPHNKSKLIVSYVYEIMNNCHRSALKKYTCTRYTQDSYIVSSVKTKEYKYNGRGLIESILTTNGNEKYITTYKYELYDDRFTRGQRKSDNSPLLLLIQNKIEETRSILSDGSYGKITNRKESKFDKDRDNTILFTYDTNYKDNKITKRVSTTYDNGLIKDEYDLLNNVQLKLYEYTFYKE